MVPAAGRARSVAGIAPADGPSDHYFAPDPSVPSRPRGLRLVLDDLGTTVDLVADTGVFAGREVDPGTRLLVDVGARPPAGPATLLDLGCGYGPIAIALALRAPEATVWAVDVNRRALDLCAANAERAGVSNRVRTAEPDGVPDDVAFDGIWSNPPIRVGKDALHELLTTWLGRLTPDGSAHLVVARNLGADSLARWLGERGWTVDRRASKRGYRLLDVTPTGR